MGCSEFYFEPLLPCDTISIRSHIARFPDERQKTFQYLHQMCYRDWDDIGYLIQMEDEDITFFLNKIRPWECLHMVEFSGKLEYIMRAVRQIDALLNTPYYFITVSFCFQEDNRDKLTEMIDVINSFSHDCGNFTSLRFEKSIAPGDAFVGLYFIADAAPQKPEGQSGSAPENAALSSEDSNRKLWKMSPTEHSQFLDELKKLKAKIDSDILLQEQQPDAQEKDESESSRKKVNRCSFCLKDASSTGKLFLSDLSGETVCICDECVRLCNSILEESL